MISMRNLGKKHYDEVKERLEKKIKEMTNAISAPELTAEKYLDMLEELIGLEDIKKQVKKIAAFSKMIKDMPEDSKIPMVLNMEFTGNPGMAKTTVARIMAGILYETGFLKYNAIVEVGRVDLIAKYTGQTADKVKKVFEKAKGKVLFIDEAYSLLDNWENEFGDEAISTIVQEMENSRDDIVVIFAGYPDKMEDFFNRNPSMKSRVPFKIEFKDYTVDEMLEITELAAKNRGFGLDESARDKIKDICIMANGDKQNGNGRLCRNLIENAILEYAERNYGTDEEPNGDFILIDNDFVLPAYLQKKKETTPLGFVA